MYQALYRKWRPRTFDDVVGQSHITDTLKQQVAGGRLSHAYLFTGTRGTGKTTCAKILSRAVNCQSPVNGNPCNQCPACLGIENGSILDVLELDAASNNGVDQVRALRDEAVYTPAAVRKRVYIVDEVHMLSTPAFNALLKILEEPPSHLMFILATTELHKVPATIRSRCQQFAFKRILPGQIAQRLEYVAGQEGIDLTPEGAALLARLADGGLRDALSLLDQCSGGGQKVDEQAVLGELSSLARDLLMRKTAPRGGSALLTGGYDETTMRGLGELLTAPRLLQMLNRLQDTAALLPRSSSRRTDAELCLIRLCDETLDDSAAGLSARIARLEEQLASGVPARQTAGSAGDGGAAQQPARPQPAPVEAPPWTEERPPLPEEPEEERTLEEPERRPAAVPPAQPAVAGGESSFWPAFAAEAKRKLPSAGPYLVNPEKTVGTWKNGVLTLWVDSAFTKAMLNKPNITEVLAQAAGQRFGGQARVAFQIGKPSPEDLGSGQAPEAGQRDALDALLEFGEQFDNIIIK